VSRSTPLAYAYSPNRGPAMKERGRYFVCTLSIGLDHALRRIKADLEPTAYG